MKPTENKIVQARMLKYTQEIGWLLCKELKRHR